MGESLVRVEIDRIEEKGWVSPQDSGVALPLVVLREVDGDRLISFGVTVQQGEVIVLARRDYHPTRPLTHDLLCGIVEGLGAAVEGVTISGIEDKAILARLDLRSATGATVKVDCRPSDGVIIAARTGAPMFALDGLLRAAA